MAGSSCKRVPSIYTWTKLVIAGYFIFAVTVFVDIFVYVAIQLYFEGHPAFNDKAEINEKINNGNRTSSGLQQYDLF